MMYSDGGEIHHLIHHVTSLLNSQHIRMIFDDPIDMTLNEFTASCHPVRPHTNMEFLLAIGDCVAHIYRHVPALAQELSAEHAQREAVYLLEGAYSGHNGKGYEDALRHAAQYGHAAACSVIAESLKARCRQQYIHWVLIKHIEYLDIPRKLDLLNCLLEDWKGSPPEYLAQRSAKELLPKCASLVLLQANCLEDLDRMLGIRATPGLPRIERSTPGGTETNLFV
jgi:hypothetical protein